MITQKNIDKSYKIIPLNVEFDNTAAVPVIKKKTNNVLIIHLAEAVTVAEIAECGRLRRRHLIILVHPCPPPVSSSSPPTLSPLSPKVFDFQTMINNKRSSNASLPKNRTDRQSRRWFCHDSDFCRISRAFKGETSSLLNDNQRDHFLYSLFALRCWLTRTSPIGTVALRQRSHASRILQFVPAMTVECVTAYSVS